MVLSVREYLDINAPRSTWYGVVITNTDLSVLEKCGSSFNFSSAEKFSLDIIPIILRALIKTANLFSIYYKLINFFSHSGHYSGLEIKIYERTKARVCQ